MKWIQVEHERDVVWVKWDRIDKFSYYNLPGTHEMCIVVGLEEPEFNKIIYRVKRGQEEIRNHLPRLIDEIECYGNTYIDALLIEFFITKVLQDIQENQKEENFYPRTDLQHFRHQSLMEEEKKVEVTYKYYLPDNESDLKMHQNAYRYYSALHEIYDECRRIYKYDDKASKETVDFSEKIGGMANDAGIWELE